MKRLRQQEDDRAYEVGEVIIGGLLISFLPGFLREMFIERTTNLEMTRDSAERMAERVNANSRGERYIVVRSGKERK